jgi:cytochrome b561
MQNDSATRYGTVTRIFHWVMALLVIQQFFKLADRINDGEHWLGNTFGSWHISLGASVLVLVVLRAIWARRTKARRPQHTGASAVWVKGGHFLLYACMFLMPVTGLLYMLGKGYGLKLFGTQVLAKTGVTTEWMASLGSLHSPLSWLFVVLVLGHIGMALLHHFKGEDSLKRMV